MEENPKTPPPEFVFEENRRLGFEIRARLEREKDFQNHLKVFLDISDEAFQSFKDPYTSMIQLALQRMEKEKDFLEKIKKFLEFCAFSDHYSSNGAPQVVNEQVGVRSSILGMSGSVTQSHRNRTPAEPLKKSDEPKEKENFIEWVLTQGYSFSCIHFYQIRTKIQEEAKRPKNGILSFFQQKPRVTDLSNTSEPPKISPRQVMQYLKRSSQKKRSLLSFQEIRSKAGKVKMTCEPFGSSQGQVEPDEPIFMQSADGYCLMLDEKNWKMYYDAKPL